MEKNQQWPLVSIITLVWNHPEVTIAFLNSIKAHCTYPNIEVIIADNGSEIDPSVAFTQVYPKAKIVLNGKNLGFAAGMNAGIKAAAGEFLFLVNNDTEFTPGLIEGLLQTFKEYKDAGVVSPKFHYFFEKGTIEYAGYEKVNIFTGRNSMVGCKEKDTGQYNQIKETHYAHGGAMMVPRYVIEEAGLMPEEFFLYYEEFDWCEQIKRKGYKVYYQPASLIYHKESMTAGKLSPLKTFYHTRNRILFMKRNMKAVNFFIFSCYFLLFTIPKNTATFILKKQTKHLKAFWKAVLWHFNKKIEFT